MGKRIIPLPLGFQLTVQADFEPAIKKLDGRVANLKDRRTLLERVAAIVREDFRHQFAVGGVPPWKPDAPSTIAAKTNAGLPNKKPRLKQVGQWSAGSVLIASGRLRDAWGRKDSPDHVEIIDPKAGTLVIGVRAERMPYALYMQTGTRPHRIQAKAGGLAFAVAGGQIIVRRAVNHPGTAARPVIVTEGARREIIATVKESIGDTNG